ncbi:MAG: multiple sugar transport system permease protein, partial [Chloroflexota bacterium]|nr:multiple sugar transport system permease protein [Chloroflexota bacterium]
MTRAAPRRILLHGFLIALAIAWLWPLLWTVYTSLRPFAETSASGYVSLPGTLSLDNFVNAWNEADLPRFYLNTALVTIPAVALTLLVGSLVAFCLARFTWRFNVALLVLFTAGNLLPPQVIILPLYHLYLAIPLPAPLSDNGVLYDQQIGVVLIHVVFQAGFCIFVLSNYMKTISSELTQAAIVDGAPVLTIYRRIVLPLCRPALGALAVLEFTWIYNDFFWALLLMKSGDKRPITSALNNLQGTFFTDYNLLAAGSLLAAIPTLIVFFVLQR